MGASILLLGVGYEACTAFHLAEYRYTPVPPKRKYRCVVEHEGRPKWWEYEDVELNDRHFNDIGTDLDRTGHVLHGRVGDADSRLLSLAFAVDFATQWLKMHMPSNSCEHDPTRM